MVALAGGDLDHDGDLDLVAADWAGILVVYLGAGDGTFTGVPLSIGVAPLSVALGDMDGDGWLDCMLLLGDQPSVAILWNVGGAFSAPLLLPAGTAPQSAELVDLDQDDDLDVVVAAAGYSFGNPTIPHTRMLVNDAGTFSPRELGEPVPAPRFLTSGDLDADGDPDLLTTRDDGVSVVSLNAGAGSLEGPVAIDGQATHIEARDLDGDGLSDLVTVLDQQLSTFLNGGGASFTRTDHALPALADCLTIADVDMDGDADVVAGSRPLALFRNTGGTLATYEPVPVFASWAIDALVGGDLDADGAPDLVCVMPSGNQVQVLTSTGDGSFDPYVRYPAGAVPRDIELADMDRDGDLDVVVANSGPLMGGVSILRNDGAGHVAAPVRYAVGFSCRSVACADLDLDGDVDAAAGNDSEIRTLRNDGAGALVDGVTLTSPASGWLIAADLDRDGDRDLVTGHTSVHWNDGGGSFPAVAQYRAHIVDHIALADLDGDTDRDLVYAVSGSYFFAPYQLYVLRNLGR
jgi:hypothetical protein